MIIKNPAKDYKTDASRSVVWAENERATWIVLRLWRAHDAAGGAGGPAEGLPRASFFLHLDLGLGARHERAVAAEAVVEEGDGRQQRRLCTPHRLGRVNIAAAAAGHGSMLRRRKLISLVRRLPTQLGAGCPVTAALSPLPSISLSKMSMIVVKL